MTAVFAAATAAAQDVFPPPVEPPRYAAVRADTPVAVDGVLDDTVWQHAVPVSDFIQKDPAQGQPISYPTEVRVAFDDHALYISAVCFQPRAELRTQNLRRDFSYDDNDLFGVAIDGFLDKRNAVVFQTTPYGSQRDMEVIDSSEFNEDWDARWSVKTRIEDDRWVAEMAIPWRILRYPRRTERLGVVFARNIRSRNERATAPAVPRAFTAYRMAYQAELTGLASPPPSTNVQLNPYVLTGRTERSGGATETQREVGGELKWVVSPSTVVDFTLNTDFAQADVDRQAVNLERFSVFFPERRQFFLENANLFNPSVTNWIRPFFSRRIGLDDAGLPIPLDGGLRVTRRSAEQELGVLAIRQQSAGASPASSFAVGRYSRNVAGQSRAGGMVTWRQDEAAAGGAGNSDNLTLTLDGLWRPRQSAGVQAMLSGSRDDATGDGFAGQLWAYYENNLLYAGFLQYFNKDYNPGVGLEILDTNYVMYSPAISFDFRSERLPRSVRSFAPSASAFIYRSSDDGDLLFGYAPLRPVRVEFHNGAQVDLIVEPNWQRLEQPFAPVGLEIAPGDYDYLRYRLALRSDQSARLSGDLEIETGDYFDGELTSYKLSARYSPSPHIELTADVDINRLREIGVGRRDRNTRLYSANLRFAPNPRLQINALYQRNSVGDRSDWNARVAWEYRPLSYLYVVYNRAEAAGLDPASRATGRQLIAKLTYFF
ncbi:MAG: DUF5916 domain-containing protein [Pseudomonadota bacterium]